MLDLTRIPEAVRSEGGVTRRLFLAYSAALAAVPLLSTRGQAASRRVTLPNEPFKLGVASGDPDATSVVLWTKLAPNPAEPDGGMKPESVVVSWEVAEDEAMNNVVAKGSAIATPQLGHSVHAEAQGLQPDRWYHYRFHAGDAVSPIGRMRTLPAVDASPDRLRFALASCQHFEEGYYTAYEQMAKDELDLVIFVGDYIYEYAGHDKRPRKHSGPVKGRIKSLADYRLRYMQYRSDPLLQAMHARCPWFVTPDDHEFENNYANDIQEVQKRGTPKVNPVDFLVQRAAAYQAYYEMMPLRKQSLPHGPDMLLYRKASFGRLADFFVLDTRQYRTPQPNGDGIKPLNEEAMKPTNTLLGRAQRGWLDAGLLTSTATWNVLAQQVMMAMVEMDSAKEDAAGFWMDQWSGACHERMDLLKFIADRKVPNPVVLSGDIHSNWVNDLRYDDRKTDTPIIATEFVGTSISSGGKSKTEQKVMDDVVANNHCVKFHDRERGYVRCEVTPKSWTADYVEVDDVTKVDAKVAKVASFIVEAGRAGAHRA